MAITVNPLTSGTSAVDALSYDTASIAPTTNRLIRMAVINAGSNPIVTPTVAGCGLTWIQLATQVFYSDGPRITYFYAFTGASPSSGPLTISVPSPGSSSCFWDVVEFLGAGGVNNFNSNSCINCIGTGLTVSLPAFDNPALSATDCIFAAFGGHHPPAPAVEAGFTELYSSGLIEAKQLITAWKLGEDNSILLFNSDGSENQSYAGIAVEIVGDELERYIKGQASLEALRERFIKGAPLLSYPERFVKGHPALEALKNPYIKGDADLQAEAARYIKGIPSLRTLIESYIKGNVLFSYVERYIKSNTAFQANAQRFIRGLVAFNLAVSGFGVRFIKGDASLSIKPPLQTLGDAPPATASGLLSRQYLNLDSVKKVV